MEGKAVDQSTGGSSVHPWGKAGRPHSWVSRWVGIVVGNCRAFLLTVSVFSGKLSVRPSAEERREAILRV